MELPMVDYPCHLPLRLQAISVLRKFETVSWLIQMKKFEAFLHAVTSFLIVKGITLAESHMNPSYFALLSHLF